MNKNSQTASAERRSRFEFAFLDEELTADSRWHMPARFICARKNRVKLRVSGTDYELKQGNILFVWPGEEFEAVSLPKHGAFAMQFASSCITECEDICSVYHYLDSVRILDDESPELLSAVTKHLERAYEAFKSQELFYETRVRIELQEMLILLGGVAKKNADAAQSITILKRNANSKMDKASSYIIANCDKRITQAEVAEEIGISTFYFSRLFRQHTGKSFNDYLNEHRIQKALMLLGNRRISIQDVAINSGFQSISNFNKVFKKHVGVSPNEYRRMHDIRKQK